MSLQQTNAAQKTSRMATISLALAIGAILFLGILLILAAIRHGPHPIICCEDALLAVCLALPAIICGHRSKSRIKMNAARLKGRGRAVAGLFLGYVCLWGAGSQFLYLSLRDFHSAMLADGTKAQLECLAISINAYDLDVRRFPPALSNLATNDGAPGWDGPYLERWATTDFWGRTFFTDYQQTKYRIFSAGPDGTVGTPDDIEYVGHRTRR
ncbi:MAG: type II secretion system protein GspG [Kiritimatiellaeota bacterium]|nr:type II secretion system protein GspG [Kiritimatiellota bacterium]